MDHFLNESRIDITRQHNEDRQSQAATSNSSVEVLFAPSTAEY